MRDAGRPRPEGSRLATRSPGAKNGAVETADRDGRICRVCSGPVRSTRTRPTTTGGTFIWARDNRAVWRFSGTDISNSYILYNTYVRVLEAHGRFVSERIGLRCVNVFQIYPPPLTTYPAESLLECASAACTYRIIFVAYSSHCSRSEFGGRSAHMHKILIGTITHETRGHAFVRHNSR